MKTVTQMINAMNEYCSELGLIPDQIPTPINSLPNEDLMAKIAGHKEIISVTKVFSDKMTLHLKDVPLLIAISDVDGIILDLVGDEAIVNENHLWIEKGLKFTVDTMGTNVVNLALDNDGRSVEVIGEEHFFEKFYKTACYGMAFKNTKTTEVLGTIIVVTDLDNQNPMITTVLATVVGSIERELILQKQNKKLTKLNEIMMDNNQYGFLTTDLDGVVQEFNGKAEDLLYRHGSASIGMHIGEFPDIGEYMLSVLNLGKKFENIHIFVDKSNVRSEKVCLFDAYPIYGEYSEITGAYAQLRDVTVAYNAQRRFKYLSNYDEQTELPNRSYLISKLFDFIEQKKNTENQKKLALFFLDLDRFKIVNDTLGYRQGDTILKMIAKRLVGGLDMENFIARVGGDEFIVILPNLEKEKTAQIGHDLLSIFNEPIVMNGYEFHITASIGVVVYPLNGTTPEILLTNADTAMFHAKENGKNQIVYYSDDLNPHPHAKILLEASLRKAIELGEFTLYYQPKIDIKTSLIIGLEALVRWVHPELGLVPPDEFIPLAEETGLIDRLDEWVLREACRQNKKWQEMGFPSISIAVNLSSKQFSSDKLINLVDTILSEIGLSPEYLELEITETMTMNVEHAIPTLKQLDTLGVTVSVDDFGTGYSSMTYLTKFAIDRLKIDQSFISNIEKSEGDSKIVITIIRMAHSLGLKVIAEGVENEQQLQFLKKHGCDEVQGFYFSKPLPAKEIRTQLIELQLEVVKKCKKMESLLS